MLNTVLLIVATLSIMLIVGLVQVTHGVVPAAVVSGLFVVITFVANKWIQPKK